jgi:hypothetical protein
LSWERVGGELNQLLEKDAIIVPELAQNSSGRERTPAWTS